MHHALLLATWIGEQPSSANYVHKTIGLLTDAAHVTGELVYSFFEQIVTVAIVYVWTKRKFRKEHARFDEQHGIIHDD